MTSMIFGVRLHCGLLVWHVQDSISNVIAGYRTISSPLHTVDRTTWPYWYHWPHWPITLLHMHIPKQLSSVFTHLFQLCVDNCKIPTIWKSSTIIPIPKVNKPRELQDFRPVALTSLVVKNLEKILKDEVLTLVEGKLDPLQFAYQRNKGVDDAKLFILDKIYKHLEKPKSHARLLFADFSSAFNKMQPYILIERLASYFNLPDHLVTLFLNFLTDRTQQVLVNGVMSKIGLQYRFPTRLCPFPVAFHFIH